MKEALLPCPFCGGPGVIASNGSIIDHFGRCHYCGARQMGQLSEADAIAAWNNRAASTGTETRETLSKLLDFIHIEPMKGRHGETIPAMVLGDALASYKFPAANSYEEAYFHELNGYLTVLREPSVPAPNELAEAARAVIKQWDTPNWKLNEPTAAIIDRLRRALSGNGDGNG